MKDERKKKEMVSRSVDRSVHVYCSLPVANYSNRFLHDVTYVTHSPGQLEIKILEK